MSRRWIDQRTTETLRNKRSRLFVHEQDRQELLSCCAKRTPMNSDTSLVDIEGALQVSEHAGGIS